MRFIYLALICLCFTSCYDIERNCSDYKTGEFTSEINIGGTVYKSHFIRTSDLQIESYEGKTDSSTVRWINDCEVVFKTIHPKNRAERKDIHLKILTTTDSSYTFEYSYIGEQVKQKGVAKKID